MQTSGSNRNVSQHLVALYVRSNTVTEFELTRPDKQEPGFLSYFFVKKISLSRRDEYVVDGSMDQ